MRIHTKLSIVFLSLALIPMFFISYVTFYNVKNNLEKEIFSNLETVADLKVEKLETFLDDLKDDVSIAQDYYNIKLNLPVMIKFSKDRTNPDFIKAKQELDGQLRKWLRIKEEVSDVMLVSPEDKVVYSANEEHLKWDLDNAPVGLEGTAFEKAKKGILISEVFRSQQEGHGYRFGLIVAAPVFDFEKQFIGVVAFEINMGPIYRFIQHNTGLAKSAESLLVKKTMDNRILYLSPLKYAPEDVLSKEIILGEGIAVPAQKAALGQTGEGEEIDYRGKEVIAIWRPVPSAGWGLVLKVDKEEAFLPIYKISKLVAVVFIITFLIILLTALSIAKSISDPISELHAGAEIIGKGNLDYKVGKDINDEVGQLSLAFDRMAADLKESQDKLIRSEKLAIVGKLASSVAHEVRNPLGVMKNAVYYLNMLGSVKDNHDIKENLKILSGEIENVDKVISDLLEFSRRKTPVLKPEGINLIIKETLGKLNVPADIKIVMELGENLPQIQIDASQMEQVFYNLAVNAIQAMDKGGILTVSSCVTHDENIVIAFKDTGCGIPKENLQKIFEPLFSTKTKGTGLGLSVVTSLLESHGGKVEVESEVGKGSAFIVTLPIKR